MCEVEYLSSHHHLPLINPHGSPPVIKTTMRLWRAEKSSSMWNIAALDTTSNVHRPNVCMNACGELTEETGGH